MILYTLKKYVNEKLSAAYGKFFAYPVVTQTYGLDELAEHMESHNTPFSKGAIKGYYPGWRHKPGWRLNTDWRIRQHREQRLRWWRRPGVTPSPVDEERRF